MQSADISTSTLLMRQLLENNDSLPVRKRDVVRILSPWDVSYYTNRQPALYLLAIFRFELLQRHVVVFWKRVTFYVCSRNPCKCNMTFK